MRQRAWGRVKAIAIMNDLTDEQQVDALTGNAVLNGTRVSVTALA